MLDLFRLAAMATSIAEGFLGLVMMEIPWLFAGGHGEKFILGRLLLSSMFGLGPG